MSIYKRGKTYWMRFTAANGRRIHQSTETSDRAAAQEAHDALKAQLWREARLGDRPSYIWDQAVVQWCHETSDKASHDDDLKILRWLDPHLRGLFLTDITREKIRQIGDLKRLSTRPATANRHLALIRSILRRAARVWGWIDQAPPVQLYPEPKRRIRWLTREQAERLLEELPPHLAAMARFSLATGLRQANVTGLEWSQVNLARAVAWIHPDQAKARRAISVPLNREAMAVLRAEVGKHEARVFTYDGKPVGNPNTRAWRLALKRAGIEDFRWHDLRHTWASWHVQAGTPLHIIQELGGWESAEMVQRYAHLAPEHLAEYVERIAPNLHHQPLRVVK
ncbi:MAG: site-specific integrase [Gammaproteobacteria bacterium]|nr:site-specific integrase [Gammaproteobacteria bacterium]